MSRRGHWSDDESKRRRKIELTGAERANWHARLAAPLSGEQLPRNPAAEAKRIIDWMGSEGFPASMLDYAAGEVTQRLYLMRTQRAIVPDSAQILAAEDERRTRRLQSETDRGRNLAKRGDILRARGEAEAARNDPPEED